MLLGRMNKVVLPDGTEDIAINGTATVYTQSFRLGSSEYFGICVKASGSSPDLKIELEMGAEPPATEGSADSNWAVPDDMSDIYTNLTATTAKIKSVSPTPMLYARLKITGNAGNGSDTTLQAKLYIQESI